MLYRKTGLFPYDIPDPAKSGKVLSWQRYFVRKTCTVVQSKNNNGQHPFIVPNMKIGYARVSTREQNLDLQLDALTKAGCKAENIYQEKISGAKIERPKLEEVLRQLRKGDELIVWKLDRSGRSIRDCLLYTSPSPRDGLLSRMPSSA